MVTTKKKIPVGKKRGQGRKKIKIDWKAADNLLKAGCPGTEVAAHFGIAPVSLYRRCKEDHKVVFDVYCQQKREAGKAMLRVKQFQTAIEGNPTMQIFLGKQNLGQTEKSELTGKDGKDLMSPFAELMKQASQSND